jgi:alpha-tubulin suppressor-like RCC1 family protein
VNGLSGMVAVSAGGSHSLALKNDGTVWAWGKNSDRQLGDGSAYQRNAPVQVAGLTNGAGIAGGGTHSVACKMDGTVWAWGKNDVGQLGNGTTTTQTGLVQVSTLTSGVVGVAAGTNHSLALKSDGTVWAWGKNDVGQLGDASNTNRSSPVQSTGSISSGVVAIAAHGSHSLIIKSYTSARAWGYNANGQLGNGNTTNQNQAVSVSGLSNPIAIIAGETHSLAYKVDGTVWAWGANGNGQLGDGTTTQRTSAVQATGVTGFNVGLAAGNGYSAVIKNDGTVWAWGSNANGQLGDGTTTAHSSPALVHNIFPSLDTNGVAPTITLIEPYNAVLLP